MKIWIQFMEKFLMFCESISFPGIKILHFFDFQVKLLRLDSVEIMYLSNEKS